MKKFYNNTIQPTPKIGSKTLQRWDIVMRIKLPAFIACILLMPLFSGCATWAQHGVGTSQNNRFRVAVLPIEVTAEIEKTSEIMSPPLKIADEKEFIKEQMKDVATQLTGLLNSKLGESTYIEVVPIEWDDLNKASPTPATALSWSAEEFQKLKQSRNVQAVLVVTLAGYGKMKKKWLTYLIGTGVVEGVVQGVLAAKVVNNTWVGVALALEEIGQEILVWGGGSYIFNKYYSPVTLEAQLISTADGTPVWGDTVFVSVDKNAIELLPEEDRKKKEIQLRLTAKKAIVELVENINKEAKSNLSSAEGGLPKEPNHGLKSDSVN